VISALMPIVSLTDPSIAREYPSESGDGPLVLVLTLKLPVLAAQSMVKATDVVSPAVTLTDRGFSPLTVQLSATPPNKTVWLPGSRLSWRKLALVPIAVSVPPSIFTA
jgi:hypothetical protein